MNDFEALAQQLSKNEDYRILRKFSVDESYGYLPAKALCSICIIDFETTGLDETDKAIEVGLIRVEYDDTGRLGRILERYSGFEDPGFPLSAEIVKLTGITDDMVRGQRFDDSKFNEIIDRSSLVVAHNAAFDRGVGERRFPCLSMKAWACSIKDIPWKDYGISSSKLEFIAFKLGWFYDAHRAVVDSEVTGGMINTVLSDGKTGLWHILQNARINQFRVWALGASNDSRHALKERGYEWRDVPCNGGKAWRIETSNSNTEIEFLRTEVYGGHGSVLVETVGAFNRFSKRCAESEMVNVGA